MISIKNKKIARFLTILLVTILIFNVAVPEPMVPVVQAESSFGGYVMYPLSVLTGVLAAAFQGVMDLTRYAAQALMTGATPDEGTDTHLFMSDIVFNRLSVLDVNIFNKSTPNPLFKKADGVKGVVKKWYATTRIMAIAGSLIVLMYVGIKIVTSSATGDKKRYIAVLTDWLKSIALIFLLHYLLATILFVSDALVSFFANNAEFSYASIKKHTFKFGESDNFVWACIWIVFEVLTFSLIVIYLKRLILVCFLIVMGPLVVLMHTIQKISAKKSKIFKQWVDELVSNVVMQPIDALVFSIIIEAINNCANNNQPLLAMAFAFAFFPIRKWMMDFLVEEPKENKQDDD